MNEKKKTKFLTIAVIYCLGFTSLVIVAAMIGRWFNVDTSHELTITASVFGGELILALLVRLFKDKKTNDK